MAEPTSSAAKAEDTRTDAELTAIMARSSGELQAFAEGFRLARQTAAVGLPFALGFGLVSGWVNYTVVQWVIRMKDWAEPSLDLAFQLFAAVAVLASIYGILQFQKRDRVSRASWVPALFAVPGIGFAAAVYVQFGGAQGTSGLMAVSFATIATVLLMNSFAGAVVYIAWLRAGKNALDGTAVQWGPIIDEIRSRTLEISTVHGAKVTAVTVGNQFLLPGIFYATQLAFSDAIAVLDPSRPALARAGQLSSGIRGRLFRMLLLWALPSLVISQAFVVWANGDSSTDLFNQVWTSLIDWSQLSLVASIGAETVWALTNWVFQLALLALYVEREARIKARSELKRRAKSTPAPADNPYQAPNTAV